MSHQCDAPPPRVKRRRSNLQQEKSPTLSQEDAGSSDEDSSNELPLNNLELQKQIVCHQKGALKFHRDRISKLEMQLTRAEEEREKGVIVLTLFCLAWNKLHSNLEILWRKIQPLSRVKTPSEDECAIPQLEDKESENDEEDRHFAGKFVQELLNAAHEDTLLHWAMKPSVCVSSSPSAALSDKEAKLPETKEADENPSPLDRLSNQSTALMKKLLHLIREIANNPHLLEDLELLSDRPCVGVVCGSKVENAPQNDEDTVELQSLKTREQLEEFAESSFIAYKTKLSCLKRGNEKLLRNCQDMRIEVERLAKQNVLLKHKLGLSPSFTEKEDFKRDEELALRSVKDESAFVDVKEDPTSSLLFQELQNKLKSSEEENLQLFADKCALLRKTSYLLISSALTEEKVMKSSVYTAMRTQRNELERLLEEKIRENEILKADKAKQLLLKDTDFEDYMKESQITHRKLLNKVEELMDEVLTSKSAGEAAKLQSEAQKATINALEKSASEAAEISKIHQQMLSQLKSQNSRMKMMNTRTLERADFLEEKTRIVASRRHNQPAVGVCVEGETADSKQAKLIEEISSLSIENEGLRAQAADRDKLVEELGACQEQLGQVSEEVDQVSKAFEERQSMCEDLQRQLKDCTDKYNASTLMTQRLKADLQNSVSLYDKKILLNTQRLEASSSLISSYLEAFNCSNARVALAEEERETAIVDLLKTKQELQNIEKQNVAFSFQLQRLKEVTGKYDEEISSISREKALLEQDFNRLKKEKQEIEAAAENARLNGTAASASKKGASASTTNDKHTNLKLKLELMEQENTELRRRNLCTVCAENFRNCVIIKCGHVFCKDCLDTNIKTRNRRCPLCNIHFDTKDMQKLYLD